MQDNNLFGEDSTPTSPVPMIKEIALRDMTQAVDLTEFRKQNHHESKHNSTDLLLPLVLSNNEDTSPGGYPTANNDAFEWSSPQKESTFTPTVIPNNGYCERIEDETKEFNNSHPLSASNSTSNDVSHIYSSPVYETSQLLETIKENTVCKGRDHLHGVPTEVTGDFLTPNGNVSPRNDLNTPKRKEIKFALETETSGPLLFDDKPARRSSVPDSKLPKESRTFHPRKRQTVHGNRRDKTHSSFNVEKFSKEELLLMWKSSEVEYNEKLKAVVKDRQRLETKLTAMELHLSTAV